MPANTCSKNKLFSTAAAHSSQHNSYVTNMNGSSVASVDDSFQIDACGRLNLQLFHALPLTMTSSRSAMARQLERHLKTQTNTSTHVTIVKISGAGGYCLFRALAYGITRDQSQHVIIRSYIINHMTHPDLQEKFKQQFMSNGSTDQMHTEHLQKMQQSGEWGTKTEVIAAAHLFQCSIFFFSRYNRTKFCLQKFSPHFLDS